MIDLHIHVLPDLDDGPKEINEALDMCRLAVEGGVSTIVATPHMYNDIFNPTREDIIEGVDNLREHLDREGIPLNVEPGADVHIRTDLAELLQAGRLVTVGDRGLYVMIELPQDILPPRITDVLFSVQVMGVTPIISHPERNFAIQENPELLVPLVHAGNIVQLTAASVLGNLGKHAKKCAHELLKRRLVHVIASDAHPLSNRPPGLLQVRKVVEGMVSIEESRELFDIRPQRILAGDSLNVPEKAETIPSKRKWFSRRQ